MRYVRYVRRHVRPTQRYERHSERHSERRGHHVLCGVHELHVSLLWFASGVCSENAPLSMFWLFPVFSSVKLCAFTLCFYFSS